MAIAPPFIFQKWLDENRHLLKPPVANKILYPESDKYIVMVVAGPNARKDYHYNETEEWFYQLEGNITVKIQEDGKAYYKDNLALAAQKLNWDVEKEVLVNVYKSFLTSNKKKIEGASAFLNITIFKELNL